MASKKRYTELIIGGKGDGAVSAIDKVGGAGRKMGKAVAIGAAVAGAAILTLGVGAIKVGDQFNQSRSAIAVATGATGEALDGLYDDFKNTLGRVPDDMSVVSGAVGVANTLFGSTGNELADLTERTLDFSRLAGGEASSNMEDLGQSAKIFGLNGAEATAALDDLFKVTQDYNIAGDQLLSQLQTYGPIFSNAGFSMSETAAIMGQLHGSGVDLSRVGPALNKFFRDVAAEGLNPQAALADVETAIRSAASSTDALAIATEAFGAEGAQRMVSAIREGGVELTALNGLLGDNSGLIGDTASATASMGEKWDEFLNRVLVFAEPLITRIFDVFMRGMDWMTAHAIPGVERVIEVFGESGLTGVMGFLAEKFAAAWPAIRTALGNIITGIIDFIVEVAPIIAAQLLEWGQEFVAWVGPQIPILLEALGGLLADFANWMLEDGLPVIVESLGEWAAAFIEWVIPMIPPFLEELAKISVAIGRWIVEDAAPQITIYLVQWTLSFTDWVAEDLTPALLSAMAIMAFDLGTWITEEAAPWLAVKLVEWTTVFAEWAQALPGEIVLAFIGLGPRIWAAIKAAWDYVRGEVAGLASIDLPGIDLPFGGSSLGFPSIKFKIPDLNPFSNHAGGTFIPPMGQKEGRTILRAGEVITTPGNASLQGRGAGVGGNINVYLGGHLVGRALRQELEEEGRRNGPYQFPS